MIARQNRDRKKLKWYSDKDAGVVNLNRTDNITEMVTILDDTIKFLKIGDLSFDDNQELKIKLQKQFLELFKKKNHHLGSL